jgi:hypothetical protein
MRRVDDEVPAVGALRNVIGWPASASAKKRTKEEKK